MNDESINLAKLLNTADVAALLRVSPQQVRKLQKLGQLHGLRIGPRRLYFTPTEIKRYIGIEQER